MVKELFGTSDGAFLNPPFYCDYGSHILHYSLFIIH